MVAEGGRAGCSQCLVGTCPHLYPLGKGEAAASLSRTCSSPVLRLFYYPCLSLSESVTNIILVSD